MIIPSIVFPTASTVAADRGESLRRIIHAIPAGTKRMALAGMRGMPALYRVIRILFVSIPIPPMFTKNCDSMASANENQRKREIPLGIRA